MRTILLLTSLTLQLSGMNFPQEFTGPATAEIRESQGVEKASARVSGPVADSEPAASATSEAENASASAGASSVPDDRLVALEKIVADLQKKASAKTYPTLTVNGVFQADAGWIHQDSASEAAYGQIQDGADFRRARLSAKGLVTESTGYMLQMDFGFFGRPTFTDVWVEKTGVPLLGAVRIGQWKQPFSLETVSSFRCTTFMERSLLFQAFVPFRHIGAGFSDHSVDLEATWAASVFRSGQDQFGGTLSSDGGYGTAERLTVLPMWDCDGRRYLHLGAGHFFNSPPGDTVVFRTIPEFFVGANGPGAVGTSGQAVPGGSNGTPFFVSTGNLTVPFYNVLGTELLWVEGPLSMQSEAMVAMLPGSAGSAVLPGVYAQVGWFLTGEHRPYDRRSGSIDRVKPDSAFAFAGSGERPGAGAWEVACRFSWLDLTNGAVQGGRIADYTLGVNWYWNAYTKMVFNYVHAVSDLPARETAHSDLFGIRAQIDF